MSNTHAFPEITITTSASDTMQRRGEPVTMGLPLPQGLLSSPGKLILKNAKHQACPLQTAILDRWKDGSIRWLLLDWQAEVAGTTQFKLSEDTNLQEEVRFNGLHCENKADGWWINTGKGVFSLTRNKQAYLLQFEPDRHEKSDDGFHVSLEVKDEQGVQYDPEISSIIQEYEGRLRSSFLLSGVLRQSSSQQSLAELLIRVHFYAGLATVRLEVTIRNSRKAEHPGGLWDLGNGGSIYLRDASLRVMSTNRNGAWSGRLSPAPGQSSFEFQKHCELYQDSSGGKNWNSTNHVNRLGKVPLSFRGYRANYDGQVQEGLRASPIVEMHTGSSHIAVAAPRFWQNFPKAIEASPGEITLRLFPKQSVDVHEIQGGEQKNHECYIAFDSEGVTEQSLAWCLSPIHACADPEWYCQTGVIPFLTPRKSDPHKEYLQLVDAALEGSDTFAAKREVIDEYGWRHFGDIYGDHEAVYHQGPTPLVSHYNNQYDAVAGMTYQYLRSGDKRWLEEMDCLARHVVDIDIYHTDEDKSAYNHGLFWHTFHYVDAFTGTHRSYPKDARVPPLGHPVPGGGPANEQNYATGLMLHYFLTGNQLSREAAIGLAQWVIDMDDGNKTIFRWLSRSDTGAASNSRTPHYHGPGRGSANSVSVLLDGHRLTQDDKFLKKAEQLIRRCIHPSDKIERHNLLDAENRWFYTMFLQSLGRYLAYKQALGQLDDMYAYGQACLIHYARWMLVHEYPFLEKPEILEYPTETWAAQDMRKCEILNLASLHCDGEERTKFRERADYFFHYSTSTLSSMPTRTFCRPVVLMLSFGFAHNWFKQHPEESAPRMQKKNTNFGTPATFVPQKTIAIRRAKLILAAAGVLFCIGLATLTYWLFF